MHTVLRSLRVGKRSRIVVVVGALVVSLAALAGSTHAAPTANARSTAWSDIVAAAQNEGSVNLVTTETPAWQAAEQVAFKAAAGVNLNVLASGANGTLETRLSAEEAAGALQTDVYEDVGPWILLRPPELVRQPRGGRLPNYYTYPGSHKYQALCVDDKLDLSGVTINTNLVPPSEYPKTWADLLKPYWKGKIVLSNPQPGGYYLQWAMIMKKSFGLKYLQGIAAQQPSLQNSSVAAAQDVASGAKALSVLSQIDSGAALQKTGAPLKWLLLPQSRRRLAWLRGDLEERPASECSEGPPQLPDDEGVAGSRLPGRRAEHLAAECQGMLAVAEDVRLSLRLTHRGTIPVSTTRTRNTTYYTHSA